MPARRPPRRVGQWSLAVLLVVVSLICAVWLYAQKGSTSEVLVLRHDVPAGQVLATSDLSAVPVSGLSDAVAVADLDDVVGRRAVYGLVSGQVLTANAVTASPVPADGQRNVAVTLDGGRVPAGLEPGDQVDIVVAPSPGEGSGQDALDAPGSLGQATIFAIDERSDGTTGLTVTIDEIDAPSLAAYAAAGKVAILQAPRGEASQ